MQESDLALHFAARMVQKLLVTANNWDYECILTNLRTIAETWFENKAQALKAIDNINAFKDLVVRGAAAWEIWNLIKSVQPLAVNEIHDEFMEMLKRNRMLDYKLPLPQFERELNCLQGEHSLAPENLIKREAVLRVARKSTKPLVDFWRQNENWVLMSVSTHKQVLVSPIRWEGSMTKVRRQNRLVRFTNHKNVSLLIH